MLNINIDYNLVYQLRNQSKDVYQGAKAGTSDKTKNLQSGANFSSGPATSPLRRRKRPRWQFSRMAGYDKSGFQ
jgi:hypothetical protein